MKLGLGSRGFGVSHRESLDNSCGRNMGMGGSVSPVGDMGKDIGQRFQEEAIIRGRHTPTLLKS